MQVLTKEQRKAIKRIFDRMPLNMSYREFRKKAVPTIGCDGAVIVPWKGMWLGVEKDGYTHS